MEIEITKGELSAIISTHGGELISFCKGDREYIYQGKEGFWKEHAPILFPINGNLRDKRYTLGEKTYQMGIHGFARHEEFELIDAKDDALTLRLLHNEKTLEEYPFEFSFEITYSLKESLTIDIEVTNLSDKAMPFAYGAHEGFIVDDTSDGYVVEFEKPEALDHLNLTEKGLIGEGTTHLGDGNRLLIKEEEIASLGTIVFSKIKSTYVDLIDRDGRKILRSSFEGIDNLLFWNQQGGSFFCIEPWSGLPDRHDASGDLYEKDHMIHLKKGESHLFHREITLY